MKFDIWLQTIFVLFVLLSGTNCDFDCVWNGEADDTPFDDNLFRAIFFPFFGLESNLPSVPCCNSEDPALPLEHHRNDEYSNDSEIDAASVVEVSFILFILVVAYCLPIREQETIPLSITSAKPAPKITVTKKSKYGIVVANCEKRDAIQILKGTKGFKISQQMCRFFRENVESLRRELNVIPILKIQFSDDMVILASQSSSRHSKQAFRDRAKTTCKELDAVSLQVRKTISQGQILDAYELSNPVGGPTDERMDDGDASFFAIGPPCASSSTVTVSGSDVSIENGYHAIDILDDLYGYRNELVENDEDFPPYLDDLEEISSFLDSSIFDTELDVSELQKSVSFYGQDVVSIYQFAAFLAVKKVYDKAREFFLGPR